MEEGPTVALAMIVRNEAAVIERCLESVRDLIDHWTICDTGSTDRTPDLVRAMLAGIPGTLYRRPWVDFGHNRSELMSLAAGTADYLLLLDADMTVHAGADLRGALVELDADSYLVRVEGPLDYWNKRIVRSDLPWRFVGATHEYITCDADDIAERIDELVVVDHADGNDSPRRSERNLVLLEQDFGRDPDNARTTFYLAQTFREAGDREQAVRWYRRRVAMGGWDEEVFYAMYQTGVLLDELGRHDAAVAALLDAWEYRPTRAEPLCSLTAILRRQGRPHTAHVMARRGIEVPYPSDILFVHRWVYEWEMLFEYSMAAAAADDLLAAIGATHRLATVDSLPPDIRALNERNRAGWIEGAEMLNPIRHLGPG